MLAHLCGLARARYHLLLCERVDGETAARIGLVAQCVEDTELLDRARAIAARLASSSPTAIRWTKHALNHWLRMALPAFDASLAMEFLGFDAVTGQLAGGGLPAGMVIAATPAMTHANPNHAVEVRFSPRNTTLIATPIGTRR